MEIRREITDTVVKEIVGPCPNPEYLDADMEEEFEVYKQAIKINLMMRGLTLSNILYNNLLGNKEKQR